MKKQVKQPAYAFETVLFSCTVQRKHFFINTTYHLYIFKDKMIMCAVFNSVLLQKPRSQTPKYILKFSLDYIFKWKIINNKLNGFLLEYQDKTKEFYGNPSEMQQLRECLAGSVCFDHYESFYRAVNTIDQGNFGQVTKEICKQTKRTVAIKHIKLDGKLSYHSQILNEIEILKRLNHQNLIQFIEVFTDKTNYHIVTEFIDGETLRSFLEKLKQPLPQEDAIEILQQILEGLNYIHESGILHRDLKPSNLMIYNKSIKIIDFGLSCINGKQMREFPTCGTPGYQAPEVSSAMKSKLIYDQRADIFSLGCIFYKILTNQSLHNLAGNQINNPGIDLTEFVKERGKLFDIVRIMIRKQMEDRPCAAQLLQLLKALKEYKYFDVNVWYCNQFQKPNFGPQTERHHSLIRQTTQLNIASSRSLKRQATLTKI
ncbi:hypothetical protein pb186bvf_017241 [Paramecium bursaria]